jgi:hypothetical protein
MAEEDCQEAAQTNDDQQLEKEERHRVRERRVIGQEAIGVGARHADVAQSQTSLLSQSVTKENDDQFAVEVSCRAVLIIVLP